ncbi:MAG: caspase family protein, partial [Spirochaetota bacterium]
ELYSLLRTLPNRKIVVIIDVCHSGGFIGQYSDFDAVPADYDYNNKKNEDIFKSAISAFFSPSNADITPETAIVLTASGEKETSAEPGLIGDPLNVENGFFTESILFAFEHGDLNNDGYVDTLELFNEAKAYFEFLRNTYHLNYMPHISGGPVDYVLFEAD